MDYGIRINKNHKIKFLGHPSTAEEIIKAGVIRHTSQPGHSFAYIVKIQKIEWIGLRKSVITGLNTIFWMEFWATYIQI